MDLFKEFINVLILDMLEIDDETVGVIFKEAAIDEERKHRLIEEFRETIINKDDIAESMKYLLEDNHVIAINQENGMNLENGHIVSERILNQDLVLRITEKGQEYYNRIYNKFWVD
jgi:hypothetical protein